MADYAHQEIYKMIDNIKSGKLILPAIQRNFVWPEDKICALFDSLMIKMKRITCWYSNSITSGNNGEKYE